MTLQSLENIRAHWNELIAIARRDRAPNAQELGTVSALRSHDAARDRGGEHRGDGANQTLDPSSAYLKCGAIRERDRSIKIGKGRGKRRRRRRSGTWGVLKHIRESAASKTLTLRLSFSSSSSSSSPSSLREAATEWMALATEAGAEFGGRRSEASLVNKWVISGKLFIGGRGRAGARHRSRRMPPLSRTNPKLTYPTL